MSPIPQVQRVAAYAVVLREGRILLSRLSDTLTTEELWTLPGGGLDHGEDPRQAVVREVYEETGLDVEVAETARVYSAHQAHAWRHGRRVDAHSLRIVYDGWVPVDAPEPRTVEVGGSTAEAAWVRLVDVLDGRVPTVPLVIEALAGHDVQRKQRVASYALVEQDSAVLLARVSARGFHTGLWSLPGGGLEHGESPADAVVREVREECGLECEVSSLLLVADERVRGTAPAGRDEDFHSVQLVFAASVPRGAVPRVTETEGTTDAVAWVPLGDVRSGAVEVHDLVRTALGAAMLWR